MRHSEDGFTLIELLVTITVIVITLAIGIPNFNQVIRSNAMTAVINNFSADIQYARSEALKRSADVVICPTVPTNPCGTTSWGDAAWFVFIDNNSDGLYTAGTDEILHQYSDPKTASSTPVQIANGTYVIRYNYRGMPISSPPETTFVVSNTDGKSVNITLTVSGRIEI